MSLFLSSQESSFIASTNQVAHLADVFLAVAAISAQAMMIILEKGIVVYNEYHHILNGQLVIDPSLFSTFTFEGDELRLGVDIALIADSFAAANSTESSLCYINYAGEGHPLVIEFEDRFMNEKIEFLTFYIDMIYPYDDVDDDNYNLVVNHNEVQFEVILKSDVLTNLLQDLSQINTSELHVFVSNKWRNLGESVRAAHTRDRALESGQAFVDNQLNFISKGPIGYSKLLFPSNKATLEKLAIYERDSGDMRPTNASVMTSFNFPNFIKIFKAVKLSLKCKIMRDLQGVLSVQSLCKNPRLPNYSGTLITFNMLEVTTDETININSIFDDAIYEYIQDYGNGPSRPREVNTVGNAVEVPLFF